MRLLIQRVSRAKVQVDEETTGEIGKGLLVFVGFSNEDSDAYFGRMIDKLVNLRLFDEGEGKPNLSVLDVGGDILVVSQFTLYADCKKGRRPSWSKAMGPVEAEKLYDNFVDTVRKKVPETKVETGKFGAMMDVSLVNDGPVTIWLDSENIV